jgi:TolA-binding protein
MTIANNMTSATVFQSQSFEEMNQHITNISEKIEELKESLINQKQLNNMYEDADQNADPDADKINSSALSADILFEELAESDPSFLSPYNI